MSVRDIFKNLHEAFAKPAACDPALGPVTGEDGIARASREWQPKQARRRVEVMVTGDPSRVGVVADAVDKFQAQIFGGAPGPGNLELRITGFLDGCIHRSKWSKKPFKAAAQARKWHCEQSRTTFASAFQESADESVDAIVMVGHRFDDDVAEALRQAEKLKEQGVPVHCFHTGQDEASREAYEKLAHATGGVFMQLADQRGIAEVMPVIMAHLNDEDQMLALAPEDRDAKNLLRMLLPDGTDRKT